MRCDGKWRVVEITSSENEKVISAGVRAAVDYNALCSLM